MPRSARTAKLYDRLDELERQFEPLMVDTLRRAAKGHRSENMFLARLTTVFFAGKTYRDPDTAELEDLFDEILALRRSLGEPLDGGVVGFIVGLAERARPEQFGLTRDVIDGEIKAWLAAHDGEHQ